MTASHEVLQLSYYHPWVYAGSERYHQLAVEELRMGRRQAYVYVSDAGSPTTIAHAVRDEIYRRFALYEYADSGRVVPRSAFATQLTGPGAITLTGLVEAFAPGYVRASFPTEQFVEALETPEFGVIPFIYDIMDLWQAFPATPWGSGDVESYYARRADALTVVSRALFERFHGARTYLVPNAVDRLFLPLIEPVPDVADRRPGDRVRVLYMGSMGGEWFDWDLVQRMVEELPEHEFTFLGSQLLPPEELRDEASRAVAARYARLGARPNVVLAPEVPHRRIVPWLHRADVGLIPFRPIALTRAVSPLKVFEYLGAGAPVVQTGMPDIACYPGVHTAADHDEFIELVRGTDRARLSVEQAARIASFARRNTWTQRVAELDGIVDGLHMPRNLSQVSQGSR